MLISQRDQVIKIWGIQPYKNEEGFDVIEDPVPKNRVTSSITVAPVSKSRVTSSKRCRCNLKIIYFFRKVFEKRMKMLKRSCSRRVSPQLLYKKSKASPFERLPDVVLSELFGKYLGVNDLINVFKTCCRFQQLKIKTIFNVESVYLYQVKMLYCGNTKQVINCDSLRQFRRLKKLSAEYIDQSSEAQKVLRVSSCLTQLRSYPFSGGSDRWGFNVRLIGGSIGLFKVGQYLSALLLQGHPD